MGCRADLACKIVSGGAARSCGRALFTDNPRRDRGSNRRRSCTGARAKRRNKNMCQAPAELGATGAPQASTKPEASRQKSAGIAAGRAPALHEPVGRDTRSNPRALTKRSLSRRRGCGQRLPICSGRGRSRNATSLGVGNGCRFAAGGARAHAARRTAANVRRRGRPQLLGKRATGQHRKFSAALQGNPATRNRTRDHLIAAVIYSQMLYQLSYSRW